MISFLRKHVSPIFRKHRMLRMERLTGLQTSWHVIDLGGHPHIWELANFRPKIDFVNLDNKIDVDTHDGRLRFRVENATDLPDADGSFDMVFSNSLIEHLHNWETQQKFAEEVRRLAKHYWIQTPSRWSLIEPHTVGFIGHWLPRRLQPFFVRWTTVWGLTNRISAQQGRDFVDEVRLLNKKEMQILFPDAEIITERFLFLPKSYIALRRAS
jgi:hypothetical protein